MCICNVMQNNGSPGQSKNNRPPKRKDEKKKNVHNLLHKKNKKTTRNPGDKMFYPQNHPQHSSLEPDSATTRLQCEAQGPLC